MNTAQEYLNSIPISKENTPDGLAEAGLKVGSMVYLLTDDRALCMVAQIVDDPEDVNYILEYVDQCDVRTEAAAHELEVA